MIKYTTGDMFKSGADCLVNTVNCEGYMGKGIAYQFKIQFPENNKEYIKACKRGILTVGKVHTFVEKGITIVNFPTKDKWRENSKLSYVEDGLDAFIKLLPDLNVKIIVIPPLGCGNGGLEWGVVKQILQEKLSGIEDKYEFLIYEPNRNYTQKVAAAPKLSPSSLILMKLTMGLKKRTKLRLQKAAFFTNIFLGEDYFVFQRHKYGPYAHSIDIISREIGEYQNYYDIRDTKTTYQMVYRVICSDKTTKLLDKLLPAVEKGVNYANQIENDHDLEGIATVLYLIKTIDNTSEGEVISNFKAWSEDKAIRFTENEVKEYTKYLKSTGIVEQNIVGDFKISEYLPR